MTTALNRPLRAGLGAVLALSAALAAAQAAGPLANQNPAAAPTANGNTPIAPRAQPMPPNVDSSKVMAANADHSRDLFLTLDRAHRGWLDKSDVRSNQYLSAHFADCDSNHDGQLSREEVEACMPHESRSTDR